MEKVSKIILNIPHASVNGVFDKRLGKWPRAPYFINECLRKHTDWYTDYLFATQIKGVKSVIFKYSRFVCDVERLDDDPLEKIGQGIFYTQYDGVTRGELSNRAKEKLLRARFSHLCKLTDFADDYEGLIIDCHSFTPESDDAPDICVGFNIDESYDKDIVEAVCKGFEDYGYTVAENYPYSNSITPPTTPFEYSSVMIEVNKRIYLDEDTLKIKFDAAQATRWFGCMDKIYKGLLKGR